jgi:4-amino-4-deoxy-L-arabinose transferase-like glycosyltransferase
MPWLAQFQGGSATLPYAMIPTLMPLSVVSDRCPMPHAHRHALVFLAISLYCLLVLPRLLSYGMFVDGITYASIARNMAENYGSFWQPYYTATIYPTFYEHPPLGFWLQSWAYRVCGDSVYVEAWWGFWVGTLILMSLAGIWQCLTPQAYALAGTWFPLVLFIVTPMTSWALANNMLENTLTCFILLSVWLCLLSLKNPTIFFSGLYSILAGLSMFCAILIKGPVGLFPLAVPLISTIYIANKTRKVFTIFIILIITLTIAFGLMLSTNAASLHFFKRYIDEQALASITGTREISTSRFDVLLVVGREHLVPLLVGGLLTTTVYRLRQVTLSSINYRLFLCYIGIALAGSLPILLSAKQRRWYAFPSFPFYAMAIAVVFNDVALSFEGIFDKNRKRIKNLAMLAIFFLCISIYFMLFEKKSLRRYATFHHDFSMKSIHIKEREIVSVYQDKLIKNWSLVANMQRSFKASLSENIGHKYLLTTTEKGISEDLSAKYIKINNDSAQEYLLFELHDD